MNLDGYTKLAYAFVLTILLICFIFIYVENMSLWIHTLLFVILAVVVNISPVIDKIGTMPILYTVLGIITGMSLTSRWVQSNMIIETYASIESVVVFMFGLFGGLVLWLVFSTAIIGLIESTTDITFNNVFEQNIDDPYGDKHAAKILNNED